MVDPDPEKQGSSCRVSRHADKKQQYIEELYAFVAEQVKAGLYKADIIDKLIGLGVDEESALQLVVEMAARLRNIRKKTVLVAAADSAYRRELVKRLRIAGIKVRFTASTARALAIAQQTVPDMLITTVELPEGRGAELIRKVRATPVGHVMPVFIIAEREHMRDYFDALRVNGFYLRRQPPELPVRDAVEMLTLPGRNYSE